jgi:aldehyde:ferredoxin oxidoreductase
VNGWTGSVLRVDLTHGRIERQPLSDELRENFIGGRGINVKLLYDEIKAGTDALGPDNVLVMGAGVLSGMPVAAGRLNISGMSPLTNILGDSNAGSHFSPELKFAGYDHIIITGKADKPVYLWINDDDVVIRDAQHLWGRLTDETQNMLRDELRDSRVQVACIGPAGENLVKFSSIAVGSHGWCGRCGLAAVMGSKNLKAIAIRGTKGVKAAHPNELLSYISDLRQRVIKQPNYYALSNYGSGYLYTPRNNRASLTMRNATETGEFRGFHSIKGETLREKYTVKDNSCFGCIIHCRNWFHIKEGPYAGLSGIGIELSTKEAWGSLMDNSYAPSLYKATVLCNQYGLDSIECGQLIAAAMEWYQNGLITKDDLQGIELNWGNYKAALTMIPKIARREGSFFDLLAEDAVRAAKQIGEGAEKIISHSKGALKTNVELRDSPVYALGHAVSTRGADHLRQAQPSVDFPGQYERIAAQVWENQYVCTIADALEICKFHTTFLGSVLTIEEMVNLFNLATGMEFSKDKMREIAERIYTLERAFIVREGITRKDDVLVGRFMDDPIHGGPNDGLRFSRDKWEAMLDEYYNLAGWNSNGIPTRTKLESVGLSSIADELESMGIL